MASASSGLGLVYAAAVLFLLACYNGGHCDQAFVRACVEPPSDTAVVTIVVHQQGRLSEQAVDEDGCAEVSVDPNRELTVYAEADGACNGEAQQLTATDCETLEVTLTMEGC